MAEEKKVTEEVKEEIKEEVKEEAAEAVEETAAEAAEEAKAAAPLSSTEAKRKKKADRREAKAARKEANKVEEKKKRPNNLILAILIFGVLIGMFAFVGAYNYFSKPANLEKYVNDNGIADMYNNAAVSEYTTLTLKAEKNTLKMWLIVAEDAPQEEVDQYSGDEGKELLEEWGAYYLTSMKPLVRGGSAEVKIKAKQGDETLNYVRLSYKEAKKMLEDAQKEAEEGIDDDESDDSEEAEGND